MTTQTTSREEIAANVRAALAYRNLDQSDLAKAIGKSRPVASERARGVSHFRIDELQRVAALCDVPLEQLLQPAAETASA